MVSANHATSNSAQTFKSAHSLLRTVWSGRPDLTNGKRPKIGQFASKECGLPRYLKQKAHWKGEVAWISGFLGFLAGAEKRCITTTTQESIFRPKIQDCCIESSVIKIYFQPYLLISSTTKCAQLLLFLLWCGISSRVNCCYALLTRATNALISWLVSS